MNTPASLWRSAPAASPDSLAQLRSALPDLPSEYLAFLARGNGGEGDLRVWPGWLQLWPAEQLVELNAAYEVELYLPGFFAIGSDGGDTMIAFDLRIAPVPAVHAVPFIGMSVEEAELIAPDFASLERVIGQAPPA